MFIHSNFENLCVQCDITYKGSTAIVSQPVSKHIFCRTGWDSDF